MSGPRGDHLDLVERLRAQEVSLDTFLIEARAAGIERREAVRLARGARRWRPDVGDPPGRGPSRGGTLRIGLWTEPEGMDAAKATTRTSRLITEHLYSTLTALDADGRPYPDLADWIEIDDDGRTYTFGIRPGIRFHDGALLTADDVAFSLNRIRDPETHYHFEPWTVTMEGAEAIDAGTVRLRLNQSTGPILTWLAFCGAGIVPRAAVEAGRDLLTQPIGKGPYRLERGGDVVRLVRHESGDHDAWIEALEFTTIPDDTERAAALLDGRIDMDVLLGPEAWDDVIDAPRHRGIATGDGRWHWLMVNCADALLDDAGVRRAIAVGLDRVALAEGSFGPHAAPLLGGVIAPWSWAAVQGFAAFTPGGDPRLARTLLEVTGTAPGTPIRIAALERLPIGQRQAHLVAGQLQSLGFAPSVHVLDAAEWGRTVTRGGPFQLATSYWGSPINDPDDFLYMGFRSGARYDTGTCGNEALDALLEAGRASFDQAERREIYGRLQVRMAEDLPVIPTIQPDVLRGVTDRLRGFVPLRNAQLRSLREAWLDG